MIEAPGRLKKSGRCGLGACLARVMMRVCAPAEEDKCFTHFRHYTVPYVRSVEEGGGPRRLWVRRTHRTDSIFAGTKV